MSRRDVLVNTAMAALTFGAGLLAEQNLLVGKNHHALALQLADAVVSVLCFVGIFAWRKRYPVGFAVFAIVGGILATVGGVVAVVGVFTVAVHRRWQVAVPISLLGAACVFPALALYPDKQNGYWVGVGLAIVFIFAITGWGMFVRARRELVGSLRAEVAHAQQVAATRADAARRGERERIAREMHDVLAHRLSLLAVHAGALEFRPDASPEEIAHAAGVIRDNAHEALSDLRSVITVLREPDTSELTRPQPTLGDLTELVDESRAAGLAVVLYTDDGVAAVEPVLGRTLYRIVQEGLTNVRKHAPYARVRVTITGGRGEGVAVSVRNDINADVDTMATAAVPGSGTGLVGLRERAELAGGTLDYGPVEAGTAFELRAQLPWPTGEPARAVPEPAR